MAGNIIQYPEHIFNNPWCDEDARIRRAYRIGLIDGSRGSFNPPAFGFSNLTEAIANDAKIDWHKLDGRLAIARHERIGALQYALERDTEHPEDSPHGWWQEGGFDGMQSWGDVLYEAWYGCDGWTLWIEGEISIKKRIANELPTLTHFKGAWGGEPYHCVTFKHPYSGENFVFAVGSQPLSPNPAEVEVLEVYES